MRQRYTPLTPTVEVRRRSSEAIVGAEGLEPPAFSL
jgi:hypothetical protein